MVQRVAARSGTPAGRSSRPPAPRKAAPNGAVVSVLPAVKQALSTTLGLEGERMSKVDTAWLRMDSPSNLMMIVGVWILRPGITLDALTERVRERLAQMLEEGLIRRIGAVPARRRRGQRKSVELG